MFDKLRKKWNVGAFQLVLIICTFAIGGSTCAFAARKILVLLPIEKGVLWFVLYILLVTILWPVAVLLVSIFFGQFSFFKNYLNKIARRMKLKK